MGNLSEFDIGPLTWVKGEIDQALAQARTKLQAFAANPADSNPARQAKTHIHQVTGALQMVGLEGVTRVCEEMECVTEGLEQRQIEASDDALAALEEADSAISRYLDALLAGEPDVSLRLLPVYQRLAAARSNTSASAVDLFFPDLSLRPPKTADAAPVPEADLPRFAKAQRAVFQRGLLQWLRGDGAGLALIGQSLQAVERALAAPMHRAFWWSAGAFVESLERGALDAQPAIKQLFSKFDQQLRRVAEGSPKVGERLMREVLYHLALAAPVTERIRQVKDLYELDAHLPSAALAGPSEENEDLSRALADVREGIKTAKEGWLKFTSGARDTLPAWRDQIRRMVDTAAPLDNPGLRQLLDAITQAAANVGPAGAGDETLAVEMATALLLVETGLENHSKLGEEFEQQSAAQSVRVLAASRSEPVGPDDVPRLDEQTRKAQEQALLGQVCREIGNNLQHIEQVLDAYFRDASKSDTLPGLKPALAQIQGALGMLELTLAGDVLAACQEIIERLAAPGHESGLEELEQLAEGMSGLGFYMEAVEKGRPEPEGILHPILRRLRGEPEQPVAAASEQEETAEAALARQKRLVENALEEWQQAPEDAQRRGRLAALTADLGRDAEFLGDGSARTLAADVAARLEAAETSTAEAPAAPQEPQPAAQPMAESPTGHGESTAEAQLPAPAQPAIIELEAAPPVEEGAISWPEVALQPAQPPSAELPQDPVPSGSATDVAVDDELLHIYLEEANEVLAAVAGHLDACLANPDDREALREIRRGFHTLKGSGRMVGLVALGEVAWAVEQVLNQWLQEELPATPALLGFITDAHGKFQGWVDALSGSGSAQVEAHRLFERAEQLKQQGIHVVEALAPAPGPAYADPGSPEESAAPVETAPEEAAVPQDNVLSFIEELAEIDSPEQQPDPGAVVEPEPMLSELAPILAEPDFIPVEHEPIVTAPEPPAVPASPDDPAELAPTTPETYEIGGISVSGSLFHTFLEEADQHLATLDTHFAKLRRQAKKPRVDREFVRAAHTLAGVARTVGIEDIADLGRLLEKWLEHLSEKPVALDAKQLKLMADTIAALGKMVNTVRGRSVTKPARQLMRSLNAVLKRLNPQALAEAPPTPAPAPEEAPAPAFEAAQPPQPMAADVVDALDAQLLPIFLEEAEELVPQVGTSLRAWRAEPQVEAHSNALKRTLHTLKGSARMAGALQIGELTHELEAKVIAASEAGTAPSFDELDAEFDRIVELLESMQGAPLRPVAPHEADTAADAADATIAPSPLEATSHTMLRVRAEVADRLVNQAGEVSIARSRIEGEMHTLRQSLLELTENVMRLRNQVREIEIQAEMQVQSRLSMAQETEATFDPLEFDRYTRFQELTRMMAEGVNDVATVQQNLLISLDETDAALQQQGRMSRELQQELMRMRMVPFGSLSERLHRVARQTARELGKKVQFELVGAQAEVDRSVLEKMVGPLEHLLRNAVSHGIEAPGERTAAGKPDTGKVRLEARQEGNEVVLTFSDDGRGIDLERIRAKAAELGLIQPGQEVNPNRLMGMIFAPGFTTASEVTQVAGRGVGMDVVRNEIIGLGGRIEVASQPGSGAQFTVYLPLTLAVQQVVMVRAGSALYALPSNTVEQVQEYKPDQMANIYQQGEVVWQDRQYNFAYLPKLLGDAETKPVAQRYTPVLLLRSGAQRAAVQVDELVRNQEVVVKNIGPQLARVPGVTGAAVMGDGKVVLILNPVLLAHRQLVQLDEDQARPLMEEKLVPLAMVVDDSLTVRKITSRLLAREGYQVVTARDGVDALQQMQDLLPDILLVDIEMPRMDGFELTKNLRADPRTSGLPIIMITSRTADKHRNYATDLGVDVYLGKPYQEEELLGHMQRLLERSA